MDKRGRVQGLDPVNRISIKLRFNRFPFLNRTRAREIAPISTEFRRMRVADIQIVCGGRQFLLRCGILHPGLNSSLNVSGFGSFK